jgi:hypothetical protein
MQYNIACKYILDIHQLIINNLTVEEIDLFEDDYQPDGKYKYYPFFTISKILYSEHTYYAGMQTTYIFKLYDIE